MPTQTMRQYDSVMRVHAGRTKNRHLEWLTFRMCGSATVMRDRGQATPLPQRMILVRLSQLTASCITNTSS